jgi:LysR family glycine cleavage system transcriptional activator
MPERRLRLPSMQALRAFEATARLQSLTRAAAELYLTHGAISHQIKGLEDELGARLIERQGRGIRLTDEGERFAARIRSAFAELGDAIRELTERANPRRLRVSVVPSFAARWLLPRMGHFLAAHPDVDLEISATLALVDFRRDNVDLAIRSGSGSWPGVVAELLYDEIYVPVCSPRLAGGRLPANPADLARYTLLRQSDEFWKPWFDAAGLDLPEPTRGPVFNDASHMLQSAADGQGIALARVSLLGNDVRNGVLVRLFDIVVPAPFRVFLVYPPRVADSPKLAAFRGWLKDEIAAEAQDAERGGKRTAASPGAGRGRGVKRRPGRR